MPLTIARAILTAGTSHDDVEHLGRALGQLGYVNSVSRGENPFNIVDETVLAAVNLFRGQHEVEPESDIPGVPSHEASRWIGPKFWDALLTPAGNVRKFPASA